MTTRACGNCLKALEHAAHALYELEAYTPELLPPPPPGFESHTALGEYLVKLAGSLRPPPEPPPTP